ncbi:MAG: hypothetical protein B6242_05345 [Anaerolineaceae bacterium 4572_78]|nr:MAG: hypothetical protein B6242_05345 [Anaerolineaceae bacterium 4572_78]
MSNNSQFYQNLNQALLTAMGRYSQQTCFQIKQNSYYQHISYQRFRVLVFRAVKFLHEQGIKKGERVAIVAENSLEWMVMYMASIFAGGVAALLSHSLPEDMIRFILRDSDAKLVVTGNKSIAQSIQQNYEQLPDLKIIITTGFSHEKDENILPITDILSPSNSVSTQEYDSLHEHATDVTFHAISTIYYKTSETSMPKGIVFDQLQNLITLQVSQKWFATEEDDVAVTASSWSNTSSLIISLHYFYMGIPNVIVGEDEEDILDGMEQTSPTIALTTPYFFEQMYDIIMERMAQSPDSSQQMFQWAVGKGKEYRAAGITASQEMQERFARADMIFFSQIRGYIGGRMRHFYSCGAPIPEHLSEFYEAVGLTILSIYSVTEAGGFPTINRPNAWRHGSCGQVAPGFQIRLADDGEILIRGDTIMREYWRQPTQTDMVTDADGWLHSGDLGRFDRDGYLYITGHKQKTIILSTGQKIIPSRIEGFLGTSPFIHQAIIFGKGKPYISALIVPDLKMISAYSNEQYDENDDSITIANPKVKKTLDDVIAKVNQNLDRWTQIQRYKLLEKPIGELSGERIQSVTNYQNRLAQRYKSLIEELYPIPKKWQEPEVTHVQITPERLQILLEKETILDTWMEDAGIGFLFELAFEKQIDAPSMLHICDTVAAIAQMESEEKALSTALIVGNPTRIRQVLPESEIKLTRHDHIRRMRKIVVSLAKMVDGLVLGYVVDRQGYLRGIHKLNIPLKSRDSYLLGPQFQRHATISKECGAVVFFVPMGGRQVRVFSDGHLVGRYSNGDWSKENLPNVSSLVVRLSKQKNYKLELVKHILRCAFRMSEENLGAIFMVGNADKILTQSDLPEIDPFASIISTDVADLSEQELINFAKQDGATIIDGQGQFRGCMVLLRPDANTKAEVGPGKGARHSSAAKMSSEMLCMAITVSQDGPITIYDSGKQVLSL